MKIPKLPIKMNQRLITFYATMSAVLISGLVDSGKNVSAYSLPAEATFYTKQNRYLITLTSKTSTQSVADKEIETATRELRLIYQSSLRSSNSENNSELIQAFLPSGFPNEGIITSEYGTRVDPISGEVHNHDGTDISLPEGTPIYATANGVVTVSKFSDSYGFMVEIQHINGYSTVYAHNSELSVSVGDYILKGDVVALSGNTGNSTGPHLHYEVRLAQNPVPPMMGDSVAFKAVD